MTTIILEYLALYAPALVSVLGVVALLIGGLAKVKTAIENLCADEVLSQLSVLIKQNAELTRANKLLTDHLAKIEGYSDTLLGKEDKK